MMYILYFNIAALSFLHYLYYRTVSIITQNPVGFNGILWNLRVLCAYQVNRSDCQPHLFTFLPFVLRQFLDELVGSFVGVDDSNDCSVIS